MKHRRRPEIVKCSHCDGDGCDRCNSTGWVEQYKSRPGGAITRRSLVYDKAWLALLRGQGL